MLGLLCIDVYMRIYVLLFVWQLLLTVLKKKLSVDKEHVKALQKMTQSMHEDSAIRQLHFEG